MTRLYRATPEQRFWQYVDKSAGPDACWPWTASRNRKGYGQLWTPDAGMVPAHRFNHASAGEQVDLLLVGAERLHVIVHGGRPEK